MAILTNKHNLPESLIRAVESKSYKKVGRISVTGLLRPPIMRVLGDRHDSDVSEDAADRIWALFGTAMHHVLQKGAHENSLAEERLSTEILGWKISGQPDLLDSDGTLWDYKCTSVYSFILGDKPEWEAQLNIYAWLYHLAGFDVRAIKILAVLRDWMGSKAVGSNYPPCQVQVVDIPEWDYPKTEQFVRERILMHQEADKLDDAFLQVCSPGERWERPRTFAVMKKGRKSAMRVLDSMDDAVSWKSENGGDSVAIRDGECIRCSRFCNVARWCSFGKDKIKATEEQ